MTKSVYSGSKRIEILSNDSEFTAFECRTNSHTVEVQALGWHTIKLVMQS